MKNSVPENSLTKKKQSIPTTSSMIKYFMVFFLCSLFVSTVMAAASSGESWKYMLFHQGPYTDMYMDFFNSIRDGGSEDVYSGRNNIYPPLCILIFRIFSKLIDPALVSSTFPQRKLLQIDQISAMIYIIFAIICVMSLMRLIESYANIQSVGKKKTLASVISFTMIVSYPVMFCLERGNILILSVVFAMFFIFFKDSENKVIREISYIALALSAAIKIYPAIFGLSLIIEKKYKEAVRLMIYGIIIVCGPFVFFINEFRTNPAMITQSALSMLSIGNTIPLSGEANSVFEKLIKNILNFAMNKKNGLNFSSVSIQNFVFMAGGSSSVAKAVCMITEAIALVSAFFVKREWQRTFLLAYLMLNIPSASNSYALSFLIIPFMIFLFQKQEYRSKDWIYLWCYALILTPLPTLWFYHPDIVKKIAAFFGAYYNTQLNQYLGTAVVQFMFFFIVIETVNEIIKRRKTKKAEAEAIAVTEEAA